MRSSSMNAFSSAGFFSCTLNDSRNILPMPVVLTPAFSIFLTGDFGYTDWIGVYPEGKTEGDYSNATYWWYVGEEGGTWTLPDDAAALEVFGDNRIYNAAGEDGKLVPGRYKAIVLANDGYFPLDDMDPVYFEVKDYQETMSRDQVTVDGADKAAVGGNDAVTEISENLYPLAGKQIRFWGWYGNDKALDKFGIRIDGGEMVYSDRYEDTAVVDGVSFRVLCTWSKSSANVNSTSVVLRMTYQEHSILFLGDAWVDTGNGLLRNYEDDELRSEYVQMAHHGQSGTDEKFYTRIGAAESKRLWPTPVWVWNVYRATNGIKTDSTRSWLGLPPDYKEFASQGLLETGNDFVAGLYKAYPSSPELLESWTKEVLNAQRVAVFKTEN